jgi:hypothetical protein
MIYNFPFCFTFRTLFGTPETCPWPRRRWKDNIRMDLREIGWDGIDWIDLAEDRDQGRALVNMVINHRVP